MRRAVLWDSSAILALLDADDRDHERAVRVARRIAAEARPSFVTNYVEVETHALLVRKLGRTLARDWLLAISLAVLETRGVRLAFSFDRHFRQYGRVEVLGP